MVHLKIVLDTRRKKSDGTFPIYFRIIDFKKVYLIPAGVSIKEEDWDKSNLNLKPTHPNAGTLNVKLSKRYYEIQKAILNLEEQGNFCFEQLKSQLIPKQSVAAVDTTFITFANKVVDDFLLVKRTGNALVYKTAINRLMGYCKNPKLKFTDIDYMLLSNFQSNLIQDGIAINTVGNYFRSIRAIYNRAIKAKIVKRDSYPFYDLTIKTEKTSKRAIDVEELKMIFRFESKANSPLRHAANFFFLSFALRGMSFTDMAYLKANNIQKGYLSYRRRKTKKVYTIKLSKIALEILANYRDPSKIYLLPIFPDNIIEDSESAIKATRQWIKVTNRYLNRLAELCKIENNITTYVTRHTWATIAKKKLGYSNEIIAECLGHEYGNKITNIYLDNFDQSLIDEVNERVIQLIL